jgi:hypothetical protein
MTTWRVGALLVARAQGEAEAGRFRCRGDAVHGDGHLRAIERGVVARERTLGGEEEVGLVGGGAADAREEAALVLREVGGDEHLKGGDADGGHTFAYSSSILCER